MIYDPAQTARNLRKSVGLTAIGLPLVLMALAGPQDSISAFYWTDSGRDALVGALAVVMSFLFGYSCTDWRSRWASRTAAGAAFIVGWFPTAPANPTDAQHWMGVAHGLGALLFFGALAYHAWQLFPRDQSRVMTLFYRACSVVIVAGIVVSAFGILTGAEGRYVFWSEAIAIWAFGLAYFVVGREPST